MTLRGRSTPKKRTDLWRFEEENLRWEAWKRGVLDYKLRPEQRDMKSLLYKVGRGLSVFNISRRLGKTTTCVTFSDENARRVRQDIRYGTAFLTDLEGFVLPIFEQVLSDCPAILRPRYFPSKKVWKYRNGSAIKLVGVDKNPNGLRGNAIDIMVLDESAFVKNLQYIYRSIIVPATMKRRFRLIFPSTPPESPEHFWAKELIPRAKALGSYILLTIDAISDLPREERKRILDEVGGEFSTTARREFFCEIIADDERAVATSFRRGLHVQPYEPTLCYWQCFGDTGGVRDKTVILKATWCPRLHKKVIRSELVYDNKTPSPVIIEGINRHFPGLSLVLDASGQTLIDYGHQGLTAMLPQKDDFQAGVQMLNAAFYRNEVLIHPDCDFLIRSLEGGLLNRARTDFQRSDELGHLDAIAALIYTLRMLDCTDYFPEALRLDPSKFNVPDYINPAEQELMKLANFGGLY